MNIGDFVYVYLYDLDSSLSVRKKLNEKRFGKIIEINEININKNNVSEEYVIKLVDGSEISIKQYVSVFKIINMKELQKLVLEANYLNEEEKDNLMDSIKNIIDNNI